MKLRPLHPQSLTPTQSPTPPTPLIPPILWDNNNLNTIWKTKYLMNQGCFSRFCSLGINIKIISNSKWNDGCTQKCPWLVNNREKNQPLVVPTPAARLIIFDTERREAASDLVPNDAPYVTRTETAPIAIDPKSLEFVNCPMQTPVNQDGEYQLMIALPGGKGL